VLLGGGRVGNGAGIISDKIIKIPSKRGPDALRLLLNDYDANSEDGEYYHNYFLRMGRNYFYTLLKPLGDLTTVIPQDYIDWGQENNFVLQTAVGECAGVMIDLISTLLNDSEEKIDWSTEALRNEQYADSIYHSYSSMINTAKALLLTLDIKPSTQIQVILDFQKHFVESGQFAIRDFKEMVLQINKNEPTEEFAIEYLEASKRFLTEAFALRNVKEEVNK
jgi:sulfite reductase (ferredoxin)